MILREKWFQISLYYDIRDVSWRGLMAYFILPPLQRFLDTERVGFDSRAGQMEHLGVCYCLLMIGGRFRKLAPHWLAKLMTS